jgi:hypothetical protein
MNFTKCPCQLKYQVNSTNVRTVLVQHLMLLVCSTAGIKLPMVTQEDIQKQDTDAYPGTTKMVAAAFKVLA